MVQEIELEFIGSEKAMTMGRSSETFSSPWAGLTHRIDWVGSIGRVESPSSMLAGEIAHEAKETASTIAKAATDTIRSHLGCRSVHMS